MTNDRVRGAFAIEEAAEILGIDHGATGVRRIARVVVGCNRGAINAEVLATVVCESALATAPPDHGKILFLLQLSFGELRLV